MLQKLRIKAWVDKESWWSASWYQQSRIGVVWFCQLKTNPVTLNLFIYHHGTGPWRVFLIWPTVVKGVFFTRERILQSSTTVVFRGLPGLLVLLSSPVRSFFLRMFQTVVLATPNVFAISLMGLFCFFSLMMACFTDSDSSLDLILTVDSNRFQMQIAHLKWTLDLLSAHCNWDNEGITHTWPWNSWEANCPITFGPLTSGRHICKLL